MEYCSGCKKYHVYVSVCPFVLGWDTKVQKAFGYSTDFPESSSDFMRSNMDLDLSSIDGESQ